MNITLEAMSANSTEATLYNRTDDIQTMASKSTPEPVGLDHKIAYAFGSTATFIGIIANSVVIGILVIARQRFGSNVNTLIINQAVMDLCACICFGITASIRVTGEFVYSGYQLADDVMCILLDAAAPAGVCVHGEKVGLVVITLERYFKIVHAVAHRKHYRSWMTKVGVALPWISGVCMALLPSIGTSRVVNGTCFRMSFWPNTATASAFSVLWFLWLYVIPVGTFAYCYAHIFHTIRRQSKVVGGHAARPQEVPMATTSRDQNPGQIQQQATGASAGTKLSRTGSSAGTKLSRSGASAGTKLSRTGASAGTKLSRSGASTGTKLSRTGASAGTKLSRTEMNVLKTMVAVIICFIVCWSVFSVANFLHFYKIRVISLKLFNRSAMVGFFNPCINPFIYAARYEVFRRTVTQLRNKENQNQATRRTAAQMK